MISMGPDEDVALEKEGRMGEGYLLGCLESVLENSELLIMTLLDLRAKGEKDGTLATPYKTLSRKEAWLNLHIEDCQALDSVIKWQ